MNKMAKYVRSSRRMANQIVLGFGNKAKRQQPSGSPKAVAGRNTYRRCQRINMVATVDVIAFKTLYILFL